MPLRISAFPKCYLEEISGGKMSVFEWIEMAKQLDADGLEMYEGFFTSLDADYLDRLSETIHAAGFEMPMLCCSPNFTAPELDDRKREIEREAEMIRVTRKLGGEGGGLSCVEWAALSRCELGAGKRVGGVRDS